MALVRTAGPSLRDRAVAGRRRVRAHWWSIVQCAVGAALAWEFARLTLGHSLPLFAPVAAIVCLGISHAQRIRRVGELALGVTLGVGIGDLLIHEIGHGGWQLAVVVILGMTAAQSLDSGGVVTNQAALQSVFVCVLPPPSGGLVTRWEDALVGGAVALLVAALAPPDPRREVAARAQSLVTILADVLSEASLAIRTRDPALADDALYRARATQSDVDRWERAILAGEEISRISPLRRHRRPDLERYRLTLLAVDRATRNLRVALRRIAAELDSGENLSEPIAEVLADLAAALRGLHRELSLSPAAARADGTSAAALMALAPRLDPQALGAGSLSATVVVAQVRSAVIDLLGAHGMSLDRARALLP